MRPRAFWRFAGRLEHEQLEFKRSAGHLKEAIPAMAMSRGGVLVLGVSGRPPARRPRARPGDARQGRRGRVRVGRRRRRARHHGRRPALTLLVVPAVPDRIVTTPDGRLLRRVGSANQPLRGEAVTRFVLARALPADVPRVWTPQVEGAPAVSGNAPADYWPGRALRRLGRHRLLLALPQLRRAGALLRPLRGKLFAFGEFGLWGADDAGFVTRFFRWVRAHPRTRLVVYFQAPSAAGRSTSPASPPAGRMPPR